MTLDEAFLEFKNIEDIRIKKTVFEHFLKKYLIAREYSSAINAAKKIIYYQEFIIQKSHLDGANII